jgi:hypothetical protein
MIDFLVHFNERFLLALKFISERVLILVQDLSQGERIPHTKNGTKLDRLGKIALVLILTN